MKKNEVLAIVAKNGRNVKPLTTWKVGEKAPLIGRYHSTGNRSIDWMLDLNSYADDLQALQPGECFTVGRGEYCNVRPGYEEHCKYCAEEGLDVEYTYENFFRTISHIHAFVERDGNSFKVYDCSLAGTVIINLDDEDTLLPQPKPAPEPEPQPKPQPKRHWWDIFKFW